MADSKISALAAVTTLNDTDEIVLAVAGATKKMTGANLKTQITTYRSGGTDVAVADGGTGASTAAAGIAALGVGSLIQIVPLSLGTANSYSLTTSLTAIGNSRFPLDPADWTMLSGKTPRVRIAANMGSGVTSGDVLEVEIYDADGAASLTSGTLTTSGTWSANRMAIVRSSSIDVPNTKTGCYIRARNQTGARGVVQSMWLEFTYS